MRPGLRQTRRTKIVCTIGPATQEREQLEALLDAGMDVARLNFSHGEHAWHAERVALVRAISEERGRAIGIIADLPGPKLRVGEIPDGPVELHEGDEITLSAEDVPGSARRVSVNYPALVDELEPGDRVLVADGEIELNVVRTEPGEVHCLVVVGGSLSSRKGLNFPTRTLTVPSLTKTDREAVRAGLAMGVDFFALSFVRTADDVQALRDLLLKEGGAVPVIAKIEKHEALRHLDEILESVDGVLVARGDLAVEIPLEDVPQAQKRIIRAANAAGKPVITATQMLQSMVTAARPTRAETTDVANALYDGTDAVMLSEETAIGEHPARAVKIMQRICVSTERDLMEHHEPRTLPAERRQSVPDAVAAAACLVARHLKADALLIPTRTGSSAAKIASFRPTQPIIAIPTHPMTVCRLTLVWGVVVAQGNEVPTHEAMLYTAEKIAVDAGLLGEGDLVVITAGFPVGGPGTTNTVTVKSVGERLASDAWEGSAGQQTLFTGTD